MIPKKLNIDTIIGYCLCVFGVGLVIHELFMFFTHGDVYMMASHIISFPVKLLICVSLCWLGSSIIRNSNGNSSGFYVGQATVDSMPGNIYWKNLDGVYLGCNVNMAKELNLSSTAEIKGKNVFELLGPENIEVADAIELIDEQVMEQNKPITLIEKGFGIQYLSTKKPLIGKNGKVIGMIGVSIPMPR